MGGAVKFLAYDFAKSTVRGYPAERIAPVKRQNVHDGPVVLILALAVDFNWLPNVTCKTISDVQRDYSLYRVICADNSGFPSDVPAEIVHSVDDVSAQEALWETGKVSFFSVDDRLLIAMAFQRLSKTVPGSRSDFAYLIRSFVDDIESCCAATTEARREFECQKVLVYVMNKSSIDALNHVTSLRKRVVVSGKHDAELLTNASASFKQIARASAVLSQVRDTISTESEELARNAHL